jgi:site-specific recombinase XerD
MSSEWARELAGEEAGRNPQEMLPLVPALEGLPQAPGLLPEGRMILRLLQSTGMAWTQLTELAWAEPGLTVRGRPLAVDAATRQELRQWAGDRPLGIALAPYVPEVPGWVRQAADSLGLVARFDSCGRVLTPLLLRHGFAVRCLEVGIDVLVLNKLLGHTHLETTQRYIAVAMADCARVYAHCHPLWAGRGGKKKPQGCPTVSEALALIEAPRRPRDRLMLRLLYASGVRVSELLGLVAGDIDQPRGLLFVRGGKGEQDRYALIDPESLQRLQQYARAQPPGGRLFRTTRAQVHTLVVRAARELGLLEKYQALGFSLSPHSFRHACASHCYQLGMDPFMVAKLLGHDDLRNTLLYIDQPQPRLEREVQRCHPWNQRTSWNSPGRPQILVD